MSTEGTKTKKATLKIYDCFIAKNRIINFDKELHNLVHQMLKLYNYHHHWIQYGGRIDKISPINAISVFHILIASCS